MKETHGEQNVALYTKYRPQKFSDVLGQDHITRTLSDAVKEKKISHAYLFTGSRGTGKTSVARILARDIGTSEKDLYEIDAASHNSVDGIRELNETVSILPFDSNYKVYILDEVHMLSKSAFNALLKTLEEPPKHVVFVLATTEPHKIPETVASRCEAHNFRTPNRIILKKMIEYVTKQEGYKLESAATELIAILGDGSFRDCQTILQKLFRTSRDNEITVDEVEEVTGAPKNELINDIIASLVDRDLEKGLTGIQKADQNNLESKVLMKLLLERYRTLLLMKVAPEKKELYKDSITEDDEGWLEKLVKEKGENIKSTNLATLINATNEMNHSYLPYLPLELALIDIIGKN